MVCFAHDSESRGATAFLHWSLDETGSRLGWLGRDSMGGAAPSEL